MKFCVSKGFDNILKIPPKLLAATLSPDAITIWTFLAIPEIDDPPLDLLIRHLLTLDQPIVQEFISLDFKDATALPAIQELINCNFLLLEE